MSSLIFHCSDGDERVQAISSLLSEAKSTAIIFSTLAERLVDNPQLHVQSDHQTVKLTFDPNSQVNSFNPLDILGYITTTNTEDLVSLILTPLKSSTSANFGPSAPTGLSCEPSWQILAFELLKSVVLYQLRRKRQSASFLEAINHFLADDIISNFTKIIGDESKLIDPNIYTTISTFLKRPADQKSAILSLIQGTVSCLNTELVQKVVERTTFDLNLVINGRATVYVEIPPQFTGAHSLVARLWLSAFLQLATAGGHEHPMLFIVDNAAGLEMFPQLLSAQRLPAGAVEIWSFWESVGQLSVRYPADWSAFAGSCRTVEALGPQSPPVVAELVTAFGASEIELRQLLPGDRLILSGEPSGATVPPNISTPVKNGGRGHVVTFAPAHANKWERVASAIEHTQGSIVVVESAGRCHALTAGSRATKGIVVRLDPFGVLDEATDQFNPLDLLNVKAPSINSDALLIAEILTPPDAIVPQYWHIATVSLIHGILAYLTAVPEKECNLVELRNVLSADDAVYDLAVVLDTIGKKLPKECYSLISAFLQKTDIERGSILSTAFQSLRIFGDPLISTVVEKSSFDLSNFANGTAMTIYVELPAFRLQSHALLVQLWIASLLTYINIDRSKCGALFIFESPFSSNLFPILHSMQSSPNLDVWTFWESLGQLRSGHPTRWSAFLANAHRIEVIGPQNPLVAAELAPIFGYPPITIQSIQRGHSMTLHEY